MNVGQPHSVILSPDTTVIVTRPCLPFHMHLKSRIYVLVTRS